VERARQVTEVAKRSLIFAGLTFFRDFWVELQLAVPYLLNRIILMWFRRREGQKFSFGSDFFYVKFKNIRYSFLYGSGPGSVTHQIRQIRVVHILQDS
jgi:hypothetical protein